MFFGLDWQVFSIIPYLEDFLSSVNLFSTTRLSRGFRYTNKKSTARVDFCLAQREGFALEFCKAFGIEFEVMLCKILRSPFKNNALCCFFTAFESLLHSSPNKKSTVKVDFLFGAEGGIRTLVRLLAN